MMSTQASGKLRVFLAEDDGELRALIASALRRDGHQVVEAGDGPGLMMQLGQVYWRDQWDFVPSLIVSDLNMPGRDGLSILQTLRRHLWCPPFILITAFGDERLHAEATQLGARAVLDKPFDLDDLRAVINRLAHPGGDEGGAAA